MIVFGLRIGELIDERAKDHGVDGTDADNPATMELRDSDTRWEIVGLADVGPGEAAEGLLFVGGSGGGVLRVLDGAQAEVDHLYVGSENGTDGTLEIGGKGADDASAHVTSALEM